MLISSQSTCSCFPTYVNNYEHVGAHITRLYIYQDVALRAIEDSVTITDCKGSRATQLFYLQHYVLCVSMLAYTLGL